MLSVDEQPVIAGAGQLLGDCGANGVDEDAKLGVASRELGLRATASDSAAVGRPAGTGEALSPRFGAGVGPTVGARSQPVNGGWGGIAAAYLKFSTSLRRRAGGLPGSVSLHSQRNAAWRVRVRHRSQREEQPERAPNAPLPIPSPRNAIPKRQTLAGQNPARTQTREKKTVGAGAGNASRKRHASAGPSEAVGAVPQKNAK